MDFFRSSGVLKKECGKAAQILKGFIEKGRLPKQVIANAKGLAIFTGFRAGMYLAGSSGSGIVIARLPDGTWSPPSSFSVKSGGIGLVYGVDVYDCVCVLNTDAAVEAYTDPEFNLGGALALAAGPIGGNANTSEVKPVWTYTRSRGLYGGLTVEGTAIKERPDVNADFYGSKATAAQILRGDVAPEIEGSQRSTSTKMLYEVLRMAEGKDADAKVIQEVSTDPTPGELKV